MTESGRPSAPAPQPDDDRLQLLAPFGQLVDPAGRGRGKLPAPHHPRSLELAQALGEDVGLALGRPARRSVKRLGPSSNPRTTKSAQRSPTRSRACAAAHASSYVRMLDKPRFYY